MDDFINNLLLNVVLPAFRVAGIAALLLLSLAIVLGLLMLAHVAMTLPMRRAERARMFLDLLESTLKQGRPVEETLISLGQTRDLSLGVRFHLLTAWLETGLSLEAALARVPHFLPPQVTAMLRAGRQLGDLLKVLPATRKLLNDATSQTRGAMNYLLVVTFVITPTGFSVFGLLSIFVIPKFMEVFAGMGIKAGTGFFIFLAGNMQTIILIQLLFLLALWLAVFVYIGGPRVISWFPILERWQFHLPWRRRRMQRDFSHLLALLLDGGVPEAEALTLAAESSANSVFRRRGARALAALRQGVSLPEAVQAMDDSGEFRWRLRNAAATHGGFMPALAGWHESLDARAFQLEQAATHAITTALVIWSGLFVGSITVAVFLVFTSLINSAVLW